MSINHYRSLRNCIVAYKNWKEGEPDNDVKQCAITAEVEGWSLGDCNDKLEFLCQIPGTESENGRLSCCHVFFLLSSTKVCRQEKNQVAYLLNH